MTPIPAEEREKMLAVRLCGPRVIARLQSIGITHLADLADCDAYQLIHEVNLAAGRPIVSRISLAVCGKEAHPSSGRLPAP